MSKKIRPCLRKILLVFCGAVLGINVYQANASRLLGNQLPMPFGYGAAVVLSGSMEPEFSEGDLILVKEAEDLAVNDIVVFEDGSSLVVHRIVELQGDQITTKGDANDTEDKPVPVSKVKGKVLCWIPYAGAIVSLLKTPAGIICTIAAAIALVEIPYRREKEKDEEERQRIIEEIRRLRQDKED